MGRFFVLSCQGEEIDIDGVYSRRVFPVMTMAISRILARLELWVDEWGQPKSLVR